MLGSNTQKLNMCSVKLYFIIYKNPGIVKGASIIMRRNHYNPHTLLFYYCFKDCTSKDIQKSYFYSGKNKVKN